jgi:hypothetical protein
LNPEELCKALVNRAMAKALPGSVDDLHRLARREFGRLKRHVEIIVSFSRHAGLSVTGIPRRSLDDHVGLMWATVCPVLAECPDLDFRTALVVSA